MANFTLYSPLLPLTGHMLQFSSYIVFISLDCLNPGKKVQTLILLFSSLEKAIIYDTIHANSYQNQMKISQYMYFFFNQSFTLYTIKVLTTQGLSVFL